MKIFNKNCKLSVSLAFSALALIGVAEPARAQAVPMPARAQAVGEQSILEKNDCALSMKSRAYDFTAHPVYFSIEGSRPLDKEHTIAVPKEKAPLGIGVSLRYDPKKKT